MISDRGDRKAAARRAARTAAPAGPVVPDEALPGAEPPVSALIIDALGRKCPIPIIMLAERIREVPIGALISVLADDPAARTDLPAWCGLKSQEFVVETTLPRGWAFTVRRSY